MKEMFFENAEAYNEHRRKKTNFLSNSYNWFLVACFAIMMIPYCISISIGAPLSLSYYFYDLSIGIGILAIPFGQFTEFCSIRYSVNHNNMAVAKPTTNSAISQLTNNKRLSKIASYTINRNIKIINDEHFRVHYYPLFIAAMIMSILGIVSAISAFSSAINTLVIEEASTTKSLVVSMEFLYTVIALIEYVFSLIYLKKWHAIYRFEYEELSLSEEGKSNLIYREKVEYKKHKAEQKEINRQQKITRRAEQKEQLKERQQEIKTNLQNVKHKIVNTTVTSIASRTHFPQMTKIDKLKELDDLLKNNVITQAEYDVARRDILGQ